MDLIVVTANIARNQSLVNCCSAHTFKDCLNIYYTYTHTSVNFFCLLIIKVKLDSY